MELDFRDAVANLIGLHAEIAAVSDSADEKWKLKLITLRRTIQVGIAAVREAAERCEELRNDPGLSRKFIEGLSSMRSALAFHQASWPAVRIDLSNREYLESVAKVRESNRSFAELAREVTRLINKG